MSSEEEKNKELARRFMEARVKGDMDAVDEMMAPDFVGHAKVLPGQEPGCEGEARHHRAQRQEPFHPPGIPLYSPKCVEGVFSKPRV